MPPLSRTRPSRRVALLACCVLLLGGAPVWADQSSSAADFLYQLGVEYHRAGDLKQAAHELHKALIADPSHRKAAGELRDVESALDRLRQQAMERTLAQAEAALPPAMPDRAPAPDRRGGLSELSPEGRQVFTDLFSPGQAPPAPSPASLRVPDPRVNGAKWFYVFGRDGNPDYGAFHEPQRVFVEIPPGETSPVRIRVLDADAKGKHDELSGGWDTTTAFRVFGGPALLDLAMVGPEAPDGTTVAFGPFTAQQGEPRGGTSVFHVEAEGISGDDNNLFAVEVSPPSAQSFSFHPAIRLPEAQGSQSTFFPAVPAGTTHLTEANYDLDAGGGRAVLIPRTPAGRSAGAVQLAGSDTGEWATTDITVPPGTDGARWTYRIIKGDQRKANMAFRLTTDQGEALPIYTTKGGTPGFTRGAGPGPLAPRQPSVDPGTSCNTFKFDASTSYDPDHDPLTYSWDFGDGERSEGIVAWHTYQAAGSYRVVLTVTDKTGKVCGTSTAEELLHVNLPPKAALEAPTLACAGDEARFSAADSSDTAGEPLTYRWDFGDGTTGEGARASHAYSRGGLYLVKVTVDDGRGTSCSTDTAIATVRVNSPPQAQAAGPVAVCASSPDEPLAVTLSAVGSADPDLDTLTYRWNFGDGTEAEGMSVSHVYARGGKYTALVTVDDGSGTSCSFDAASVPVHVNHPPQAVLRERVAKGCPDEPVAFDAGSSSDADGDILTYRWDFGTGETGQGAAVEHRYPASGAYRVKVTVDDGSGMACGIATATAMADINAPPIAQMIILGERASPVPSR